MACSCKGQIESCSTGVVKVEVDLGSKMPRNVPVALDRAFC